MSDIFVGYDLRERPGSIEITFGDLKTKSLTVEKTRVLIEKLIYAADRVQRHNYPPKEF